MLEDDQSTKKNNIRESNTLNALYHLWSRREREPGWLPHGNLVGLVINARKFREIMLGTKFWTVTLESLYPTNIMLISPATITI